MNCNIFVGLVLRRIDSCDRIGWKWAMPFLPYGKRIYDVLRQDYTADIYALISQVTIGDDSAR